MPRIYQQFTSSCGIRDDLLPFSLYIFLSFPRFSQWYIDLHWEKKRDNCLRACVLNYNAKEMKTKNQIMQRTDVASG